MNRLDEAIEIIQALRQAINSGMCCDIEDFLGRPLYVRMLDFLGENVGSEEDEEYEDEDEE